MSTIIYAPRCYVERIAKFLKVEDPGTKVLKVPGNVRNLVGNFIDELHKKTGPLTKHGTIEISQEVT